MGGMRSDLDVLSPGSKRALLTAWSSLKSSIVHTPLDPMAGSKRSKVKKLLSPTRAATPPPGPAMDDDALMDDLLAQLDSKDTSAAAQQEASTVLTEVSAQKAAEVADAPKKDSRTRHQARQARKAALLAEQYANSNNPEADAKLEQEAREEERIITKTCEELGVRMHEINPDGHCLFSAVGDQLAILGLVPAQQTSYGAIRHAAADFIEAHPDDFIPFLPMEDEAGTDTGLMSPQELKEYCAKIRDTAVWGGEPEITALARAYNVPIHVIQAATPHIVPHNPSDQPPADESKIVRISYHRRMYGLGEHYNSLRPKRAMGFAEGFKSIFTTASPPPQATA